MRSEKLVRLPVYLLWACIILAVFSLSSCGGSGGAGSTESDSELRPLLSAHRLTGDPSIGRSLPEISDPLAQLGMKLFFAQSLGGDFDSACVTCHHPALGGGDDLPLSIGVGAPNPALLGSGRTHPEGDFTVPRNAPTTLNIGLWNSMLFWDGRVEMLSVSRSGNHHDGTRMRTPDSALGIDDPLAGTNLAAAQSRFPVTSPEEMRGFEFVAGESNESVRNALSARLSSLGWGADFEAAFGDSRISYDRIAEAIGAYERSQVFVDSPWKRYVDGEDSAISESAKRGALLFFKDVPEGGADCASCHSGDFFTDEKFWATAAPQIGRGKGDGPTGTNDYGRAREVEESSDRFAFRTPSLLNVEVTGPWTHAGAYSSLEDVVRHQLDPRSSVESFDLSSVAPAFVGDFFPNMVEMLMHLDIQKDQALFTLYEPLEFTDQQVLDLTNFLRALTDPCVTDWNCLSPWIPNSETRDPDGSRLEAEDSVGNLL